MHNIGSGDGAGENQGGPDGVMEFRRQETLFKAGALQSAIFNSANFSSIATDEKGVIQIFNVGAERMLGYTAAEVMNKITPADISDPQEVIARAKALSVELTAFAMKGDDQKAFDAGCDGYITKPIDTRTLPDQVAEFLARASGQSRRSRIKILVIEDHAVDSKLAELVLSTDGHNVSAVEAAEQALAAIQKDRPQLIFLDLDLDLDLPGMDGLALARQLKADLEMREIHIVAVTFCSERYPKAAALAAGCDAYLLKPINTRELSGQLTAVAEAGTP